MRRFSFRLEQVLELRDYGKRIAEATLAMKAAACARLDMALKENAAATLKATRERFRPGTSAVDHCVVERYSLRLSAERERLLKALAHAEAERETARLAYVEASKAKEIVQKLREREEAAYYVALSREETRVMDDLAAGAHARAVADVIGA